MKLNQAFAVLEVTVLWLVLSHMNVFGETAPTAQEANAYIPEKPAVGSTSPAQTQEVTFNQAGEQTLRDGTRVVTTEMFQGGQRVGMVYAYYPPNSQAPNVVELYDPNGKTLRVQTLTQPDGRQIIIPYVNGIPVPRGIRIIPPPNRRPNR